jgi:hypothetical protein
LTLSPNAKPHSFEIVVNLANGDPKHLQTQAAHVRIATAIVVSTFRRVVMVAIEFDDQMCVSRVEIGDVRAQGMLSPKLEACGFAAQDAPQALLGLRGLAS